MKQKQYPDIVDSKINPKQANPKYLIPKMVTESKLIPGPVLLASGRARSALTQAGPKSLRLSTRSSRSSLVLMHASCSLLVGGWLGLPRIFASFCLPTTAGLLLALTLELPVPLLLAMSMAA